MPTRRDFLSSVVAATAAGAVLADDPAGRLHVATNVYPWMMFYRRDNRDWNKDPAAGLAEVARSGLHGFEPIANSAGDVQALAPLLKKHGLAMRSLYVNSKLHDEKDAAASIETVLQIAEAAKPLGCHIVVTNPTPIRWGGPEDKSDAQLLTQAKHLDRLGSELRTRGVTLAYHNHDAEMRQSAREFHHMMNGTDPRNVALCLDSHWVFRGSGDSQVCLFDVVKLYGKRVVELHLRQSSGGVWTEAFGPGDIDYPRLARTLQALELRPHVVLEQAVEAKSPKTLDAVTAHRQGREYAAEVFAAFAG